MLNSSKVCCDANLVVQWTMADDPNTTEFPIDRWLRAGTPLIAPALLHFEIANVLHRIRQAKHVPLERAQQGLQTALSLPITLYDDDELHLQAFAIAARFGFPASYDAHYLALASREDAQFWTHDKRLFNAVRYELPWVILAE